MKGGSASFAGVLLLVMGMVGLWLLSSGRLQAVLLAINTGASSPVTPTSVTPATVQAAIAPTSVTSGAYGDAALSGFATSVTPYGTTIPVLSNTAFGGLTIK